MDKKGWINEVDGWERVDGWDGGWWEGGWFDKKEGKLDLDRQ